MKISSNIKNSLLLVSFLLYITSCVTEKDTRNPITQFLTKRGYTFPDSAKESDMSRKTSQWPDTLYYNTVYKSKLLGSITLPFLTSNIEIAGGIPGGVYTVSPTVSIGAGYTWFWGDFIFNEDDKITVDPKVFFGLAASTGLSDGLNLKSGGLFASGFIGVSTFNLVFGYDIINHSPALGIGARIDFFSLSQKFLHVLGKVQEVRRHKSIARPITGE